MTFVERLRTALSAFRSKRIQRRTAFPAAAMGRLTSSWTDDPGAVNRWLRWELKTLRARSRQLARGDAYAAKFFKAVTDNVAGPLPFQLEGKIGKPRGKPDDEANSKIEDAWYEWGALGGCEITGKFTLNAIHKLLIRALARDGEILARKIRGEGKYGFQLQLLDIDRLDEMRNEELTGGGSIKLGVEMTSYSKPVAYWILKKHPGENGTATDRLAERVPADQIIHLFVAEWPEQVRGIPWMHAAMLRLWNLGGFEDAAVINARVGANKLAVLTNTNVDNSAIADLATGEDSAGNVLTDSEPGQYWTLPKGYELSDFSPEFPTAAVEPFIRACLRGASASVGMAYHSFANDPGAVNYSTARMALLEERDSWMSIQQFWVENFCQPLYDEFRRMSALMGVLPGEFAGERFRSVYFQPKRWKWIDPEKEVNGQITALEAGLTSRTRIAAEQGEDLEDIMHEVVSENALAESLGIEWPVVTPSPAPAPATPREPEAAEKPEEKPEPEEKPAAKEADFMKWIDEFAKATKAEPPTFVNNVTLPPQSVTVENKNIMPEQLAPTVTVEGATVNVENKNVMPDTTPVVNVEGATVNVENIMPEPPAPLPPVNKTVLTEKRGDGSYVHKVVEE